MDPRILNEIGMDVGDELEVFTSSDEPKACNIELCFEITRECHSKLIAYIVLRLWMLKMNLRYIRAKHERKVCDIESCIRNYKRIIAFYLI